MLNGEHRGDSDRADGDARNAGEADPPPPIKVMLLAGGDLIESFQVPGLWAVDDVGAAHVRV